MTVEIVFFVNLKFFNLNENDTSSATLKFIVRRNKKKNKKCIDVSHLNTVGL